MWSVERPLAALTFCGVLFPKGRLHVAPSRLLYPKVLFWKLRKDAVDQEQLISLELKSESHARPGQRCPVCSSGEPGTGSTAEFVTSLLSFQGLVNVNHQPPCSEAVSSAHYRGILNQSCKFRFAKGQINPSLSPVHLSGALPTFCISCGSQE